MRCALIKRKSDHKSNKDIYKTIPQSPSLLMGSTSHTPSSSSSPSTTDPLPPPTHHSNNNNNNKIMPTRQTRSTSSSESSRPTNGRQTRQSHGKGSSAKTQKVSAVLPSRPSGGRHLQPPIGNDAKLKHKCPFDGCPWRFATPYKLRRHIKSHTKETPYQCKECGRGFSVRYNLLMHIQTIHSTPQKHTCPVKGCKDTFHTQSRLNGHLRKVHKTDMKQIQADKKTSTTNSPSSSSNPSPADQNDSANNEDTTSNTTATTATGPVKSFACKECPKTFTTQSKLSTHLRTVHSTADNRPFKCTVEDCKKSFLTSDKLQRHLQTHTAVKSWVCPYKECKRVFTRQSYLKNHLKVHSKGQYMCPMPNCGQRLSSELDYNDHINLHMGYSLPCPQCSLFFPTPKRLELHCHVAHGMELCLAPGFHMPHLIPTTPITPLSGPSPFSTDKTTTFSHPTGSPSLSSPLISNPQTTTTGLPDLGIDEIEAFISNQTVERFFNSLTSEGYESDSGYSTFDVSPHGSHASSSSSSNLFNGLLSPAITPLTPTSTTPTSLSPFTFSDEGLMGGNSHAPLFSAPPLSAASSCDGNYFFNPVGPEVQNEAFTDHTPFTFPFPPSQPGLVRKHDMLLSPLEAPPPKRLQTAGKAMKNNEKTIEDSKQTVVFIPNSFTTTPTLITPSSNLPMPTSSWKPSVAIMTTPPPVRAEDSVMIRIKPELSYVGDTSCHGNEASPTDSAHSKINHLENGRVYAQVVTPTLTKATPTSKTTNKSSTAGKSRHRSNSKQRKSVSSNGTAKTTTTTTWPKSMNSGNLVAFRNFILKKLKKDQEGEDDGEGVVNTHSFNSYDNKNGCGQEQGVLSNGLEDMFNDIDFNPDSLLSLSSHDSRRSLSPFNSPTMSDMSSSDPFSPSPYDHVTSLDEMDFDGFFQLYDINNPTTTNATSTNSPSPYASSNILLPPLSQDFDTIFKTDADPLLGALT